MQVAGWACDAGCFANNPNPDLREDYRTMDDVENVDVEDEDANGSSLARPATATIGMPRAPRLMKTFAVCGDCGAVHDRDVNAARNLLRLERQTLAEGGSIHTA
jgi:hypothetical protein